MKNRGFSLIEVVVTITLIGIIAGIGIPKLRRNLAIGRDTKAIVTLNMLRQASELYYSETGTPPYIESESDNIKNALDRLKDYLDPKTFKEIKDNEIDIGGSRTINSSGDISKDIKYGGKIKFTFTDPEGDIKDGVYLWFNPENIGETDTKGNKWINY